MKSTIKKYLKLLYHNSQQNSLKCRIQKAFINFDVPKIVDHYNKIEEIKQLLQQKFVNQLRTQDIGGQDDGSISMSSEVINKLENGFVIDDQVMMDEDEIGSGMESIVYMDRNKILLNINRVTSIDIPPLKIHHNFIISKLLGIFPTISTKLGPQSWTSRTTESFPVQQVRMSTLIHRKTRCRATHFVPWI